MPVFQCSAFATSSHLAGGGFMFYIFTRRLLRSLLLLYRSCSSSMILPGHCQGPGFSPSLLWTAILIAHLLLSTPTPCFSKTSVPSSPLPSHIHLLQPLTVQYLAMGSCFSDWQVSKLLKEKGCRKVVFSPTGSTTFHSTVHSGAEAESCCLNTLSSESSETSCCKAQTSVFKHRWSELSCRIQALVPALCIFGESCLWNWPKESANSAWKH